jgi:hypothetical protein
MGINLFSKKKLGYTMVPNYPPRDEHSLHTSTALTSTVDISLREVHVVKFTFCGDFCGDFHHKSKTPYRLVAVF